MLLRFQIDTSLQSPFTVCVLKTLAQFFTTSDTSAESHKLVLGFNIAAECVFAYNATTLLANRPLVCQVIQQCFIEAGNWTATSKAIFHPNKMEYTRNAVLHQPPICIRGHNVQLVFVMGFTHLFINFCWSWQVIHVGHLLSQRPVHHSLVVCIQIVASFIQSQLDVKPLNPRQIWVPNSLGDLPKHSMQKRL